MSWFDATTDVTLTSLLRQALAEHDHGVVAVGGRGGGGHVWFSDGEVVYAQSEEQPQLRIALQRTGAVDALGLAELGRSAHQLPSMREGLTAAVTDVVRVLTEDALADMLELTEGSARVRPGEVPPFGILTSMQLDDLVRAASVRRVRARVAALGRRGAWRTEVAGANGGPVQLSDTEWRVVAAMAVPTTAPDVSADTGLPFDEVRSALANLAERGLVGRTAPASESASGSPPATPPPTPTPARTPTVSAASALDALREHSASAEPTPRLRSVRPAHAARPVAASTEQSVLAASGGGRASALRRLISAVRAG